MNADAVEEAKNNQGCEHPLQWCSINNIVDHWMRLIFVRLNGATLLRTNQKRVGRRHR